MGQLTLHPIKVTRLEAWKNNNKQANKQKQKTTQKQIKQMETWQPYMYFDYLSAQSGKLSNLDKRDIKGNWIPSPISLSHVLDVKYHLLDFVGASSCHNTSYSLVSMTFE